MTTKDCVAEEPGGSPMSTINDPPAMHLSAAGLKARILAAVFDLPVVAAWAVVAAAAGFVGRSANYNFDSPVLADAFAFSTLIAPITLTWAWQEASSHSATYGKRSVGLVVTDRTGDRIRLPRSLARTGLKLLPWQLAHTAVFGLLADSSKSAFMALSVAAQALVVVSLASVLIDSEHRALHDRIVGTRVAVAPTRMQKQTRRHIE